MNRVIGAVTNTVVECTDVDGIVRKIDVNDVVGKWLIQTRKGKVSIAWLTHPDFRQQ